MRDRLARTFAAAPGPLATRVPPMPHSPIEPPPAFSRKTSARGDGARQGILELAQALGDFASLAAAGRRALHLHLPSPEPARLRRTLASLVDRLPRPA